MEIQMIFQIIFVMNFNWKDKAIGQCKSGKSLGMFGNVTWDKTPTGTDWKVATKYFTVEDSHEMFAANLESFILRMIYIGSQIIHSCYHWISTTQCTFTK